MERDRTRGSLIETARKRLKQTQAEFARSIGATRSSVSAYETGLAIPAGAALKIAALMPDSETTERFLSRADISIQDLLALGTTIRKGRRAPVGAGEIHRVPIIRKTAARLEETGRLMPISSAEAPESDKTVVYEIDQAVASESVLSGSRIVVDTSNLRGPGEALGPLSGRKILVERKLTLESERSPMTDFEPRGLMVGWLRFKTMRPYGPLSAVEPRARWVLWLATVGPYNDPEQDWGPGSAAAYIGDWYAIPKPRATSELEWAVFEHEAKKKAPAEIRLLPSCKILGRVICEFPPA